MSTAQTASTLYKLQVLDLELDRVTAEKQNVVQTLQGNATLRKAQNAYTQSQQQLHASEQAQKEAEWVLEDLGRRLATQEQRLYGGTGINVKDLEPLRKEVQNLQAQHNRQEKAVIDVMDVTESLQEDAQRRLRELQKVEEDWHKESATLLSRREQLETRQQELQGRRVQMTATIPANVLQRYDSMRKTKQGRAVSKVEQGSCQWCRVILTPSELQHVRVSNDLQTCTNCGRILYYER